MRLRASYYLVLPLLAVNAWGSSILGTADGFAVLGGQTVTNTGATTITGNLGVSPGTAITGEASITQTGTVHKNDGVAIQAQSDVTTAYNYLANLSPITDLTGKNLGGLTLDPGIYHFDTSAQLTGALTLDAHGSDNAFWAFQIGSTLTSASSSSVQVINAGLGGALYWQVGSSATLGTSTTFEGNILALTSITLNTGATIPCGRALARNGAVTMDTNIVSTGCSGTDSSGSNGGGSTGGGTVGGDGGGTAVPEPASFLLVGLGLSAGLLSRRLRAAL